MLIRVVVLVMVVMPGIIMVSGIGMVGFGVVDVTVFGVVMVLGFLALIRGSSLRGFEASGPPSSRGRALCNGRRARGVSNWSSAAWCRRSVTSR
jgi:hypothetical protein